MPNPSWRRARVRLLIVIVCVFQLALVLFGSLHAQVLRLEIEPEWDGTTLLLGRQLQNARVDGLSVSRLDGLLSHLALQRKDGSWMESARWHAFFSLEKQKLSVTADGLQSVEFQAIRFQVGLDPDADAADPQTWPPDHPLHPDVCGLHWGWQGGYVFLALEGHWNPFREAPSGFSYHLAGAVNPMKVELPVKFSGARSTTIRLGMDIAKILTFGDVLQKANSTHSRESDDLSPTLKTRVPGSFRVKAIQSDIYQANEGVAATARSFPRNATPLALGISARLPKLKLPEDNPLTVEGVNLGRRLFHDPRLSRTEVQSCATCHDRSKAFTDGQPLSRGVDGQLGRRNAMPLLNLAWAREFFWDGRAKSLRTQVLVPIQDVHEMNETLDRVTNKLALDPDYPALFGAAFGSEQITSENLGLALEQFLLTLISQESRFDRAARKLQTLTSQEQRGLQLFITEYDPTRGLRGADCFHCHGGNLFSNHQFMNNGLAERSGDLGRMELTHQEIDRGKFKVPTLRNVALTGPYMHDGRFATLEEVVDHYNGPLHRTPTLDPNLAKHPETGLGLSADDKAALVSFLRTLTDDSFVAPDLPERSTPSISRTP